MNPRTFALYRDGLVIYFTDRGGDTIDITETVLGEVAGDTYPDRVARFVARQVWKQMIENGARKV
jgi:hypothetical protein